MYEFINGIYILARKEYGTNKVKRTWNFSWCLKNERSGNVFSLIVDSDKLYDEYCEMHIRDQNQSP